MSITTVGVGVMFILLSIYGLWVGFTQSGEYLQAHLSYRAMIPFRLLGLEDNMPLIRATWLISTGFVGLIGAGLVLLGSY